MAYEISQGMVKTPITLWAWQRKQKKMKKDSVKLTTSLDRSQSFHAGWPPVYSIRLAKKPIIFEMR